ncbi:MAG: acyl-CoA dehydrogenase family protein [Rhodocyclaceae bacterium]|nr:acyl-CoA dehydrogenase family protein [Rhodocyclaceae bacterium]
MRGGRTGGAGEIAGNCHSRESLPVIPAKAGIHEPPKPWIPAPLFKHTGQASRDDESCSPTPTPATTPPTTKPSAPRCAASSNAKSSRTPPHGTRPAASRARCTARPPRPACSASASPRSTAGTPADHFYRLILAEEMGCSGSGGTCASLMSHTIGLPPVVAGASPELKARILPGVIAGEKISALAVTEPGAGSDVAQLATTAKREGDHYVVNGAKMFITSGMRADWSTVAVRTGGPGAAGVSLLAIERDTPGFTRTELKKMGWWASDTAELHFDDCRVPAENLIGAEGQAFPLIMRNFNGERLTLAASACGAAIACLEDAVEWARSRKTFGQPLIGHQVIRHKLVDMVERIEATRALLDDLAARLDVEPPHPSPLPGGSGTSASGRGGSSPLPARGERAGVRGKV